MLMKTDQAHTCGTPVSRPDSADHSLLTWCRGWLAAGYALSLLLPSGSVDAGVVSTTADSGPGSLRQAILDATPDETITFASDLIGQTVVLTSGELVVDKGLVIQGPSATQLAISGGHVSRVFRVDPYSSGISVMISGLTIKDGNGADLLAGGGVYNSGVLTLDECVISGNSVNWADSWGQSFFAYGGGIFNDGALTLNRCTVKDNQVTADEAWAMGGGGGILNYLEAALTVNDSTLSGNTVAGCYAEGGAIMDFFGTVTLNNCTISGNTATGSAVAYGGGLDNAGSMVLNNCTVCENLAIAPRAAGGGSGRNGPLKLNNCIVARNSAAYGADLSPDSDAYGPAIAGNGRNLVGVADGVSGLQGTEIVGTAATPADPVVGPLKDNGGITMTHALLAGSPAINAGSNSEAASLANDQRGEGFQRIAGGGVDLGAFEVQTACEPPHVVITGPACGTVFAVGSPVVLTGIFDRTNGPHSAFWTVGGEVVPGAVDEAARRVTATIHFTRPGIYSLQLALTNACGQGATADTIGGSLAWVVVYDANAGFVTGGGWITSPLGAWVPNPAVAGKANLAIGAKYLPGATVPTGQTEFQFKPANLNFKSTGYQWLVVGNGTAIYLGTGTVNGTAGYGFLVAARQSGNDVGNRFRIKIWQTASQSVVYDSEPGADAFALPGTTLGGGSIVVHQ